MDDSPLNLDRFDNHGNDAFCQTDCELVLRCHRCILPLAPDERKLQSLERRSLELRSEHTSTKPLRDVEQRLTDSAP